MPTPTKKRRTLNNKAQIKLGALVDDALVAISAAVKLGDMQAASLVISYIVPKPKQTDTQVFQIKQDIWELTLTGQLAEIRSAVLGGECSLAAADTVLGIILKERQILNETVFEERLTALEESQYAPRQSTFTPIQIATEKGNPASIKNDVLRVGS